MFLIYFFFWDTHNSSYIILPKQPYKYLLKCFFLRVFTGGMSDREKEKNETLDLLLSTTYCCSQTHLSQQLSQLHPELTMPMFSGMLTRDTNIAYTYFTYLLVALYRVKFIIQFNTSISILKYFIIRIRCSSSFGHTLKCRCTNCKCLDIYSYCKNETPILYCILINKKKSN